MKLQNFGNVIFFYILEFLQKNVDYSWNIISWSFGIWMFFFMKSDEQISSSHLRIHLLSWVDISYIDENMRSNQLNMCQLGDFVVSTTRGGWLSKQTYWWKTQT
jgi:hypothetical protein